MDFVFYQKQNVRAFIIILGMTMKAVAFESQPEVNGFVQKFVIFFRDQFILMMYFISYFDIISAFTPKQEVPEGSDPKKL